MWYSYSSSSRLPLFDHFEAWPRFVGWGVRRAVRLLAGIKHHPLTIFSRIDSQYRFDGNNDVGRNTPKPTVKSNIFVTHIESHHCSGRDIKNDLAIANVSLRHLYTVDLNVNQ